MEHRKLSNTANKQSKSVNQRTRDKTRAMNILETTTTLKNNHYEIGLLWKTDNLRLPINSELAQNNLVLLEKK